MIEAAASVDKEVTDESPDVIKKIIEEKGYLPEQDFKASIPGGKKCHKGHLLERKTSEHQSLSQEGIGQFHHLVQMLFSSVLLTSEP